MELIIYFEICANVSNFESGWLLAEPTPSIVIGLTSNHFPTKLLKNLAPRDGLEPPTRWLTATCSTN